MTTEPEIAVIGAALAHDKRVALISALLSGEELTAGSLARVARVSPPAASAHLQSLRQAGLVVRTRDGRQHRYRLASSAVAALLEQLAVVAQPPQGHTLRDREAMATLRAGRTCYDHLAGRLGVGLADRLIARGVLRTADGGLEMTVAGEHWFTELGLDLGELRRRRRPLLRSCLDWTERRPHLAGSLGAAFTDLCLAHAWVRRIPLTRAVTLTRAGAGWFRTELGLELTASRVERPEA